MSFYYEKKSDIDELIKEDLSFNSSTIEHEKKMDISNDQFETNNFTDLIKNVSFINFSKEVDEFNENKRASLIENEKSIKKKSITGISYSRTLTKSILNEENSVIQNLHFKKASNIINKHLDNTENVFGFLKNEFKIYFFNCYENSNFNNLLKNQENMIKDVQIFIDLISNGIYSYYNLKKYRTLYSNSLFTKYNILNLVISNILKDRLFESILKKQEIIDEQINYDLSLKIDYYSNFGPEKFEIPKKFCLNQTISEKKENETNVYMPYSNTIEILKGINLINDPIKKINIIMTAAEMIQKEIKDYYEKKGILYNENIGGDELLSIFLYLLTKIKIYNLYSQCILIDKFLSNAIINSVAGFYLATVQVAMKYLLESNTDSFIKRFPIN